MFENADSATRIPGTLKLTSCIVLIGGMECGPL